MAINPVAPEVEKYEKLKKPILDIINFTNTLDKEYREKCFEVLLNHYLATNGETNIYSSILQESKANFTVPKLQHDYPLELKTFLQEYNISEEIINKLFLREKGEVRPIYKILEKKKAVAQIQIALLTAFENALMVPNGALEFPMKNARQRCVERSLYDNNDFIYNFKIRAGLFASLDSEVVKLTPIGKTELANVMNAVSKQ